MPKLSVVIPVYNEQGTIEAIVQRVVAVTLPCGMGLELLLVDDCSTDGSWSRMQAVAERLGSAGPADAASPSGRPVIRLFRQNRNRGKGAAIRLGFAQAAGDVILIQDADLEYDPADYPRLLAPILAGQADVVYGSRFSTGRGGDSLLHYLGNRALTWLSNLMTGLKLTDMETCYKVFRRDVVRSLTIRSDRFEVEPELTARVARGRWRLVEVPVSYAARRYSQGKKITWVDGLRAVWTMLRCRLFS